MNASQKCLTRAFRELQGLKPLKLPHFSARLKRLLKKFPMCQSSPAAGGEETALRHNTAKKQIPRAKTALGMTSPGVFQHPVKSCPLEEKDL